MINISYILVMEDMYVYIYIYTFTSPASIYGENSLI